MNSFDKDFKCPVCFKSAKELFHLRKNGRWFSGIEIHHFGRNPNEDYMNYLESQTIKICYLCNSKESRVRKFYNIKNALSVDAMKVLFKDFEGCGRK